MDNADSIRAIPAPADAVLPQAGRGFLGVVMLDTRFPRPPGDVGHPQTFAWPVRYRVVPGAWPAEIVTSVQALRSSTLVPAFIEAMRELQAQGARALTTSCGFLVLLQRELQAAVSVPLVSSSLLALPQLLQQDEQVGVLTINAQRLGPDHLLAAGVPPQRLEDVLVEGVDPSGEFARCILGNHPAMDLDLAGRDVVQAAMRLKQRAPQLRNLVLECTNMPPYAQAIREATGWHLHSLREAQPLLQCFGTETTQAAPQR